MSKAAAALGSVAVIAFGAMTFIWSASSAKSGDGAMPDDVDLDAGKTYYAEACAACHGANLEGQDDWQTPGADGRLPAPPHDRTGHTWHHADRVLFDYTKLGGQRMMAEQGMDFDSGMPGFGDQLTDQEIWDILAYIKSTWPERIQEVQAERTESEAGRREN